MIFSEDSRVKIPCILHLVRLGYRYHSLKNATWDEETNIFPEFFREAIARINPGIEDAAVERLLADVKLALDNEDLGRAFYEKLTERFGARLIDFTDFASNSFHVVTELTCKNGNDEFRPDITLLVNGMPLAFIEVKKPNNPEGILAERNRIIARCRNRRFRRFINVTQLMVFSNNMEYADGSPHPIEGAFYASSSYDAPTFNYFREEEQLDLAELLADEDDAVENAVLPELEALAKTLYDYWFVQFDFPFDFAQGKPDANGKPYQSSGGRMVYNETLKREIPAEWKAGTLDDLGQIVGGSTPSTKSPDNFTANGTPWITPNDLSDNQGNKFITRGAQDVSAEGIKDASLKKYPAGTVLLSSRAPIGYMAIARTELTTNQGFKSFIPTNGYSTAFIYYTVKNSLKAITQYASGSTFKEASATTLKIVKISLPASNVVSQFTASMTSIFKRQALLEQENQHLIQLRDWLLPMLMNGQVTVA